eukprot:scaffold162245_cov32-Tisochrysis_lutea.AAC.1
MSVIGVRCRLFPCARCQESRRSSARPCLYCPPDVFERDRGGRGRFDFELQRVRLPPWAWAWNSVIVIGHERKRSGAFAATGIKYPGGRGRVSLASW